MRSDGDRTGTGISVTTIDGSDFVKARRSVGILVVDDDEDCTVTLVRQYRPALGQETLEIPGGKIEAGETEEEAAIRELWEECGYKAFSVSRFLAFDSSPGFSDEFVTLFFTDEYELGEPDPDPDERISIVRIPYDDLLSEIENGNVTDGKTVMAVMAYGIATLG